MAAPARVLAAVPPLETTAAALRALSPRERHACWRLFGVIVGVYRQHPERTDCIERVLRAVTDKEGA